MPSLPFLEALKSLAGERGVADRIDVQPGNLFELGFGESSFDLIWCEGAAYMMGLAEAARAWTPLLTPGGRMVISEPVFLRPDLPEPVRQFWTRNYPAMADIDACNETIRGEGLALLGAFVLPEAAWLDHYYGPMEHRLEALRGEYAGDAMALEILQESQEEIDLYRQHGDCYGYAFFVMSRPPRA